MMILLFFLLPDFVLGESRLGESLFTLWTGHKLYNDIKVIENGTATSVLHCAMQCLNHKQCIAANFKESLKTCETHKSDTRELSVRITTQTGCDVVVKKNFLVYNYTNTWIQHGASDCYVGNSHDYAGTIDYTLSGRTCQNWSVGYPHYADDLPINPADRSTNYCRADVTDGYLWCYTTDESVRWEHCSIVPCYSCGVHLPVAPPNTELIILIIRSVVIRYQCVSLEEGISEQHCPVSYCGENDIWSPHNISCTNEDCYSVSSAYRGKMTCTLYGVPCQRWDVNTPQTPTERPSDPDDLASNYCRDPDESGAPWCYTTEPSQRWAFCSIGKC